MDHLSQVETSIRNFVRDLKESIRPIQGRLLFLGAQPLFDLDAIALSPKKRYRIMYRHMPEVGALGQWMMKASSCIQISIDYSSVDDLQRKFVFLNRLSPFLTAIFANSPLVEGVFSGYLSYRSNIWNNTDKTRSGLPFIFLIYH